MKRYLNRLEKQQALSIASFEAYLDDRIEEYVEAGKSKELLRNLRTAKTFLHKALENIMAPLDKREVVKLLAEIRKMQVVVMYKQEALRKYNEMLKADSVTPVETEDFLDIVEQAVNICVSCTKKGEEAQSCRLAALFIKYDIEPLDKDAEEGKCPYQYIEEEE